MSRLVYDGIGHTIEMIDCGGQSRGKWTAYNNIDGKWARAHYGSARHLTDGTYLVTDWFRPSPKPVDADGGYGSHGTIHFTYPGHPGVGVHSGRRHYPHTPGPQHATYGCIRTTDEAMAAFSEVMRTDALMTVTVQGNSATSASLAQIRNGWAVAIAQSLSPSHVGR